MSLVNNTYGIIFPTNATLLSSTNTTTAPPSGPITCPQLYGICMLALQAMQQITVQPSNNQTNGTNSTLDNMTSSFFTTRSLPYLNTTKTTTTTTTTKAMQQLPPSCLIYQSACMGARPPLSVHVTRVGTTMGVFGMLACLLNIFVIWRIFTQNIRRIHQSKLYFLSMAFADMYFGFCCFIYTLLLHKVIKYERTPRILNILRKWWEISIHVTFCASLFHVIMVTADRFMATTFPLAHKICVTRKKVMAIIFGLWALSVIISFLPYWLNSPNFSSWFSSLTVLFGSVLLVVTYCHISTVALKRRKTLKQLSRNKANFKTNVRSINTSLLSTSITLSFVICNMFGAVFAFRYLIAGIPVDLVASFIELLLLNINATVNPVFYTIVEYLHHKMRRRNASMSENSQSRDRKVTTCSTIDRTTRSMESIATVNSRI